MLEASGASPATLRTVRAALANDGMVTTGDACRTLGVSSWTMRRLCRKYGIRREARIGRCGSLLDLGALQDALRNEKGGEVQYARG